jgi:hypothetical protein
MHIVRYTGDRFDELYARLGFAADPTMRAYRKRIIK